jgi:hypothetical protein
MKNEKLKGIKKILILKRIELYYVKNMSGSAGGEIGT